MSISAATEKNMTNSGVSMRAQSGFEITWLKDQLAMAKPGQTTFTPEVAALQQKATAVLTSHGAPNSRNEAWKYTSLREFAAGKKSATATSASFEGKVDTAPAFENISCRIVYANGVFDAGRSNLDDLPKGTSISRLADVLASNTHPSYAAIVEQLGSDGQLDHHEAFVANLSLAMLQDGVVVSVDTSASTAPVIDIVWESRESKAHASATRLFVLVAKDSQCTIIERYVGQGSYSTIAAASIVAAESAVITHARVQTESEAATHFSTTRMILADSALVHTLCINAGGEFVRNEVYSEIQGSSAKALLSGVSITAQNELVDNYTVIDHALPQSESTERYKGVYAGKTKGIFNGTIIVREDAQQTNAIQSNNSLLLSDDAASFSRPQLKIWADDVKCTHGATVGQMDEQALFYLRARGVPLEQAKVLLMHAFTSEALEDLNDKALRSYLESVVFASLDKVS
jgi:Fe-S cluster assembly protein SufD